MKVFWGDIDGEAAERLVALFGERLSRGQYFVPDIDRDRLMTDFRDLSRQTPRTGCRTMDILHIACALQIGAECLISYHDRQRALAVIAGLTVLPDVLPA